MQTPREFQLFKLSELAKKATNRVMNDEELIDCALVLAELLLEHGDQNAKIRFDKGEKIEAARMVCQKGKRLYVLSETFRTYGACEKARLEGKHKPLPKGVHSFNTQIKIDGEWI